MRHDLSDTATLSPHQPGRRQHPSRTRSSSARYVLGDLCGLRECSFETHAVTCVHATVAAGTHYQNTWQVDFEAAPLTTYCNPTNKYAAPFCAWCQPSCVCVCVCVFGLCPERSSGSAYCGEQTLSSSQKMPRVACADTARTISIATTAVTFSVRSARVLTAHRMEPALQIIGARVDFSFGLLKRRRLVEMSALGQSYGRRSHNRSSGRDTAVSGTHSEN